MNGYLTAAKELLDKVASQYNGDTSRLYLLGSSNGAAGVWSLLARYPQTFAAAIPVAGTGDATNASTIAEALSSTPIWTFHGDADETLSVEGTRGLVNAIKQVSDKNIIYTEVAGADHNTIWSRAAVTTGLAEWLYAQPNTTTDVAQSLGESEVRVAVVNRGIYVFTSEAANVLVYDLTGRLVASSATDAGTAAIEGLAPASYVVRVIGRSSQTARKVIL
jgi:poly(3-hydroxybutyrate) depolymerase